MHSGLVGLHAQLCSACILPQIACGQSRVGAWREQPDQELNKDVGQKKLASMLASVQCPEVQRDGCGPCIAVL
jgi:hypothetical protein